MNTKRCPAHCTHALTRRDFLSSSVAFVAGSTLLSGCASQRTPMPLPQRHSGPASQYVPTIKAAFVRRREDYGLWWPGAVYDGETSRRMYTEQMKQAAKTLGITLDLRPDPIYSLEEAQAWLDQAKAQNADGLLVMVHDRQKHAWPTAKKAAESGIPAVIFSPLGTSFTTNTMLLAKNPSCIIYSTDDFSQAAFGLKMLAAGAKIRRARCLVIKGDSTFDQAMPDLGITLSHLPAKTFLEQYDRTPVSSEVLAMADDYIRRARRLTGATRQDVINGVRSCFVARDMLQRHHADAITMDCLGAIAKAGSKVSLPCIAWSRMNDDGIPAACEADYGAVASHIITQFLFDRPGFQQDPVADTLNNAIIGAHCSCPTRLNGFDQPPEPFDLTHHHANRDAVPRTLWQIGKRITCIDTIPPGQRLNEDGKRTKILISTGTVLDNISVPPSGGCVVSVRVKFDSGTNVLEFPGFHQVFFYGDYGRHLQQFCQLFNLDAQLV